MMITGLGEKQKRSNMKHIQNFPEYNEGFLSKAAATVALGAATLAPQQAHGQLGHKIKDFVKKEISTKTNLPQTGETKTITKSQLNSLSNSLEEFESFGNLPISNLPEGNYLITSVVSKTQSAGEMAAQQQLRNQNQKIVRIFNYHKDLGNGNIHIISIAQIK
jgi:hypothetical protein